MVAFWPTLLAVLMIFDILSDCVADFILSASDHSAKRPKSRLLFPADHPHLTASAQLSEGGRGAVAVSASTTAAALPVNWMAGCDSRPMTAAGPALSGLIRIPIRSGPPTIVAITGVLFRLKRFAVDDFLAAWHAGSA